MQNGRRTTVITITVALALWSGPVAAQAFGEARDTLHLDLSEARDLALQRNPSYLAEEQRVAAAEGAVRAARTFRFNPQAEAELPRTFDGASPREFEVLVSQTLEWAGQRGLRVDAAEAGLRGAGATVAEARRLTMSEVTEAFYEALAADLRLEVAEDILVVNERLLEAVEIQAREGEISVMDANFAEIEAARSLVRVLEARREATSASLQLGRLVGATSEVTVRAEQGPPRSLPSPAMLTLGRLLETALSRRPDLDRKAHQVSQTESMARLAQREAIPNLGIGALLSGGDSQTGTGIGLQVSLPIPLWNRNQGLVEQREADVRQATLEREAVSLAVRSGVTDALQAYEVASEEEALLASRVLAPSRRNQELLEIAYQEGELGLPSLVLLRNQLLDAELGYWDAWLARRLSYTQLEAAVGSFDLDLTDPDVGRVQ